MPQQTAKAILYKRYPLTNILIYNISTILRFILGGIGIKGKWIPSHHGGTTVMTALTMGEAYGINGKELITSMVAGEM